MLLEHGEDLVVDLVADCVECFGSSDGDDLDPVHIIDQQEALEVQVRGKGRLGPWKSRSVL